MDRLKIAGLSPGQHKGRLVFKLTHSFPPAANVKWNKKRPYKFLLADDSGRIQAVAWDKEGERINKFMKV